MNPNGSAFSTAGRTSKKGFWLASSLALLCVLVTGCPHNDYTVELKPTGNGVERTLTFYRADNDNSNGVPRYQDFPSNELAAITRVYPSGTVRPDGQRHVATGEFAGALPDDVGGAGSYTNLLTSLGSAGFYQERFRGHDDLAGRTEQQFRAADKITDLVMGWTQTEFGRERGCKRLCRFLDEDFRRDLKNAGLYYWVGKIATLSNTNAPEEFIARFVQYLHERGYMNLSDVPELSLALNGDGTNSVVSVLRLVQRLVAEKMDLAASDPRPKSLAVLADPDALERSWTNYLARTDLYRAKVKEWEKKKQTEPSLKKPEPSELPADLFEDLLEPFKIFGGAADHLSVKLALAHAPNHTNGKWQDGQVVWETNLDDNRALPAFCFASWSSPDIGFQKVHFGRVLLAGDELTQYCQWQCSLGREQIQQWELYLAGLQPDQELKKKLAAFQFTSQSASATVKGKPNQLDAGSKLLIEALGKTLAVIPDSK
ncbi:MAG: hypothetical protein WCH99_07670 [Verrucomicrobiota bacterium]